MSRLHLTPPETIVPLKTAVRLLRIALTIKVVPILFAVATLTLRGGTLASPLVFLGLLAVFLVIAGFVLFKLWGFLGRLLRRV